MNAKISVFFAVAIAILVAEVSGRYVQKKGIKDHETDACGCSERIVKSKDVRRYPLKLPLECHRPGDTCRCTKVKVTPAHLPRPKYYKHVEEPEHCGKYVKAPKSMHDFSEVEDYSAEEEFVKMPVDVVSMNIAQDLQRKIETKMTEEALQYGFKSLPADRPKLNYKKNVPEGDLYAYEKTIVELQPYQVNTNCDSDEDTFQHDVKQTVNTLSYQDVGYLPVSGKSTPKFIKKTCVVDDGSHEDIEVVKKLVKKVPHRKIAVKKDVYSEEEDYEVPKKVVINKKYEEDEYEKYPAPSKDSGEEEYMDNNPEDEYDEENDGYFGARDDDPIGNYKS